LAKGYRFNFYQGGLVSQPALKVVESAFFTKEVELWSDASENESYSLHYAISFPYGIRPEIPAFFIQRFSQNSDVVLDPFCADGAVALEANLRGRLAYFSDLNPLSLRLARAKVEASDITDVTLRLQQINLRRPINVKLFDEVFSPFFDLDTFRELVNLRHFVHENADRTSRFIELIALSLLHGHSAGYFSVYSFPQIALSPAEQHKLNLKRGQVADYRAIVPRILRKTASVLRDGIPSCARQASLKNRFALTDARDLAFVPSASVSLIVTSPPTPLLRDFSKEMWLRAWFAGLSEKETAAPSLFRPGSVDSWREFMNECLLEFARVVKPGGRVVLDLCDVPLDGETVSLDREVRELVLAGFSKFFEAEGLLVHKPKSAQHLKDSLKERSDPKARSRERILVLRRR